MRTIKPAKLFPRRSKVRQPHDKFLRAFANSIRLKRQMTWEEDTANRLRTFGRRTYLMNRPDLKGE
jgi:protein involved in temperature-dependent protein secretion